MSRNSCDSSRQTSRLVVAAAILIAGASGGWSQTWTEAGTGSATGNGIAIDATTPPNGGQVAACVNSAGEPVVGFSAENFTTMRAGLHVRLLRSGAWQATAPGADTGVGIAPSCYKVENLRMASVSAGMPFAFWNKSNAGSGQSFYLTGLRLDAGAWGGIGGSDTATPFGYPSGTDTPGDVTADADGNPVIVYATNNGLYVKRFVGGAWAEMGAGSASGSGLLPNSSNSYSVPTQPKTGVNPVVFWGPQSFSATREIRGARWDGAAWVPLGAGGSTLVASAGMPSMPSACFDASNRPILVGTGLGVMLCDGSSTRTLGAPNSLGFNNASIVCTANGSLVAAGVEPTSNTVIARRYNAATDTWPLFGVPSSPSMEIGKSITLFTMATPSRVGLAATPDNTVYVSWVPSTTGIYVKKAPVTQASAAVDQDWLDYE